ncbi:MAG: beta-ketoacyl synthase chain length factor [Treponema sp.]|nr:beta-ketoacyl synthase chain length factor [Treponema sp.]
MNGDIYISRYSAWAPGIKSPGEWNEWAAGKREMESGTESPAITFTDSLFRRRLSQISKMTIQVVHDLLPLDPETSMIFFSFRGEISKQFSINRTVIEDNAVMPAAFSLSVFNAPIALTSMALSLKGGYSALYPGYNSFSAGAAITEAAFASGKNNEIIFVYADEMIPPEYEGIQYDNSNSPFPLAFSLLLCRQPSPGNIPLASLYSENDNPHNFLKRLILSKGMYVSA